MNKKLSIIASPVFLGILSSLGLLLGYDTFFAHKLSLLNSNDVKVMAPYEISSDYSVDNMAGDTVTYTQVKGESNTRQLVKSPVEITNSLDDLTPLQISTGDNGVEASFLVKLKNYMIGEDNNMVAWISSDGDIGTRGKLEISGDAEIDDLKLNGHLRLSSLSKVPSAPKNKDKGKYGTLYTINNSEELFFMNGDGDTSRITGQTLQEAYNNDDGVIQLKDDDFVIKNVDGDSFFSVSADTGVIALSENHFSKIRLSGFSGDEVLGTSSHTIFFESEKYRFKNPENEDILYLEKEPSDDFLVGIGTTSPTEALDIDSDAIRVRDSKTPTSQTESCEQGEISWDASYIYVCTTDDHWRRSALDDTSF